MDKSILDLGYKTESLWSAGICYILQNIIVMHIQKSIYTLSYIFATE